jgi:hypothetical protein
MTQFTQQAVPAQCTEADRTPSASGRAGMTATAVRARHEAAGLFRGGTALAPKTLAAVEQDYAILGP